ncbi:MAG: Citrate synthase [Chlamydiae bacterium]|nr:Citrate synthase [Chlamydiota bacterium]
MTVKEDVLFEITFDQLETGLRGVPVGYCVTSKVDPEKGLTYVDHPIVEMATWMPERVIFLLYHGREGEVDEVKFLAQQLEMRAHLRPEVVKQIEQLPKKGDPMDLFSTAILLAKLYEESGDYKEDCLNIIAKAPEIAATVINHHAGWGKTPPSKPALGYMSNFAQMLKVPGHLSPNFAEILQLFNILHYDHGGGNLSVFVGKAVASGLEGMYGSISAAMNALAGPRHGKANQNSLAFVQEVLEKVGEEGSAEQIRAFINQKLYNHELIYGFGHAVLRVEDPRAAIFYDLATQLFPDHPLARTALLLRTEVSHVLKERGKVADPYANVDAISGTVLSAAGFSYPEYYTVLFGLGRIVGIAIQILYERTEAREGKGTPLLRPKYIYKPRKP